MSMIMTFNVAQEIENAEIDMLSSRLALLQAISGNPMQIQMKNFECHCLFIKSNYWSCF